MILWDKGKDHEPQLELTGVMATRTSPFAGLHLAHATTFVHINNSSQSARFLCAVKLCQGQNTLCYLRCHLVGCWGQELLARKTRQLTLGKAVFSSHPFAVALLQSLFNSASHAPGEFACSQLSSPISIQAARKWLTTSVCSHVSWTWAGRGAQASGTAEWPSCGFDCLRGFLVPA